MRKNMCPPLGVGHLFNHRLIFAAFILSVAATSGCGRNKASSTSSSGSPSDAEAQSSLDTSLKVTDDIRAQLKAIRRALAPLENYLNKLEAILVGNVLLPEKDAHRLKLDANRLRSALKDAASQVAKRNADGTYTWDKRWDAAEAGCEGRISRATLSGDGPGRTISVVDTGCAATGGTEILRAVIGANDFEAKFRINGGQCTLKNGPGSSFLSCEPFSIELGDAIAEVERFEIQGNWLGPSAQFHFVVKSKSGEVLATIDFEAQPEGPVRLRVNGKEAAQGAPSHARPATDTVVGATNEGPQEGPENEPTTNVPEF